MISAYRFLTVFLYPFFIVIIYLRLLLKKEHAQRYKEKIYSSFFFLRKNSGKKLIWIHAASIGESQSIFPLIKRLNEQNKNLEFLITTVTLSAANLIKKKFNSYPNVFHKFFPLDIKFLVKKFLDNLNPNLIIFVDSEIWPNFIYEIKERKINLAIINGRITKKTFKRWMLISNFAKKIFNTFDLCLASSKASEEHLKQLNAKNLMYIGNIKLSDTINSENIVNENEKILLQKKFWCAASTHNGEEIFCLKTHLKIKKIYKDIITIIIPRHIDRSKSIKKLSEQYKLTTQILNDGDYIQDNKEIIIVNSFGVLPKFFKYSKSVFIGKSILKKFKQIGGQNPLQAAKLGCKIYHGPFVYNFEEIYTFLKSYKITNKINDEIELSNNLIEDLKDNQKKLDRQSDAINILGEQILNDSINEINKIL
jgi:3-deoxy-D-manno-octulosonic-acid transferase